MSRSSRILFHHPPQPPECMPGLLARLIAFLKTAGAPSEEDTQRDGFLSYSAETHAVGVGVYYGFIDFKDWGGLPEDYAEGKHIERGWYPKAGYVTGAALRVACYLVLGAGAWSFFG